MTAPVIGAIDALRERTDETWPFGPTCLAGEQRGYQTGWRSYRSWLEAVERGSHQPPWSHREVVRRIRLLVDGAESAETWSPGELVTQPEPWAETPLTTADLLRSALNGLYRTNRIQIGVGTEGEPWVVEAYPIWCLLDQRVGVPTALGAAYGVASVLGWPGLLAEAWLGYELRRRAAERAVLAAGGDWVEDPADLDRPRRWLTESVAERAGVERLRGVVDGLNLAAAWDPATPVGKLLADYYDPVRPAPTERRASNRFRLLYDSATPPIPRESDPTRLAAALRPPVLHATRYLVVRQHLERGWATWAVGDALVALESAWGSAMLTEVIDRFVGVLLAGTTGDGWASGAWPAAPTTLARYGGWPLRYGDSDAERRFGGQVRPGPVPGGASDNPVALLQRDLAELGFAVPGNGRFDESTESALRELQLVASHREVSVRRAGTAEVTRRPAHRRHLGLPHGRLDEETARTIDLWRHPRRYGLPDVQQIVRPTLTGLPESTVLERTGRELYPWSTLVAARDAAPLDAAAWRQLGDAQKALWRRRLMVRGGFAVDEGGEPPYVLHPADGNLFELEAVTEYYLNLDDPWLPRGEVERVGRNLPRPPDAEDYHRVDLLDPTGLAATPAPPHPANRFRLQLDGDADLADVWRAHDQTADGSHRDLLYLAATAPNTRRWFRITDVDPVSRTVTVNGVPNLVGTDRSWILRRRPQLVMVDPAGERPSLVGVGARHGGVANQIVLDGDADLTLLNLNFDTVHLPADVARRSQTYRIVGCQLATRTLTLDGEPALDGESSAWQIPAGLGGRFEPIPTNFTPRQRGTDHYGGAVFVVHGGRQRAAYSFTSFSAWTYADNNGNRSAVRGNTWYDCLSYRSGDAFKNYSFRVVTPGDQDDHVAHGRFYLQNMSNPRPLPGAGQPWQPFEPLLHVPDDGNGKVHIRFHDGHNNIDEEDAPAGTGSAGCIVSPAYFDLRRQLIEIHQEERGLLGAEPDAPLADLAPLGRTDSRNLWTHSNSTTPGPLPHVTAAQWVNKIAARLWLVRPDERPAGPAAL
ncbi:peptidoglycan-binding domain-containing protein [Micromonospora sp. NPDC049523]|uniref:peptidoglycan-binding domain-containing protein n=1 Tax=Micromonospora sp. NPDC049523 TaxID=3155921 RepID=UPI00342733DA